MSRLRHTAVSRRAAAWPILVGLAFSGTSSSRAEERNYWPFWVGHMAATAPDRVEAWTAAGPLVFGRPISPETPAEYGGRAGGVRPFYVWKKDAAGDVREAYALYPLLTYRTGLGGAQRWSMLNLINYSVVPPSPGEKSDQQAVPHKGFDVWPFYFSRTTGNPSLDYKALFPIAGQVKQRFGQDRWTWVLFPLYGRFEKKGVTTTTVPWPFIKLVRGDGNTGAELWPLYGQRQKPGVYQERFALWPFFYKNDSGLGKPVPDQQLGILPFYARDRSEGYLSETWLWPFFGYVDRTSPYRYHARHYFWPFLVQGRGDERYVNRWAPFYTHSVIKGTDKHWVLWPFWRRLEYREGGVDQTKDQFLYFLYHSTTQRSVANPAAAVARKVHFWPLVSSWNNGAGRRQLQILSPFEVFFPWNEPVRLAWSPLVALYRFDRRPDGEVRHSFLWDGVTIHRQPAQAASAFRLGPLLSVDRQPETGRIALLSGLIGLKRRPGQRSWHFFFGEFKPSPASASAASP